MYDTKILKLQTELDFYKNESSFLNVDKVTLESENCKLKDALRYMKGNSDKLHGSLKETRDLLEKLNMKHNLQKDMNTFFRDFYARNVIGKMK